MSKFTISISGSNIGAQALGDHATATGSVMVPVSRVVAKRTNSSPKGTSTETGNMTTKKVSRTGVFFSHATADNKMTNPFVEKILMLGMGIAQDDIFNVSDVDQGVPTGQYFVPYIRERIKKSGAIVAWITPTYLASPFCMCELGAAWALIPDGVPFFPLIDGLKFTALPGVLLGMQGLKTNDKPSMDKFRDDLAAAVGIQAKQKSATWNKHRDEFFTKYV